jgi:DNA-binding response OmpR family regulator
MSAGNVLMIDDDLFLSERISVLLESQGFSVRTAGTCEDGYQAIRAEAPELLILDLSLPDGDGVSLCKRIRKDYRFPILMLTSRGDAIDKVVGLEVGADDYVPKPFEASELLARIKAQLRRYRDYDSESTAQHLKRKVGPLVLDLDAHTVTANGEPIELTETEYKLLAYMAENVGRALSREMLFESVWGYEIEFNSNSLDVFVYRLRNKLEAKGCPKLLHTMRGYGYKLQAT